MQLPSNEDSLNSVWFKLPKLTLQTLTGQERNEMSEWNDLPWKGSTLEP